MKKLLFLTLIFSAISMGMYAQTATDQATMLKQIKEKIKPQMVEKTGLTDAQADKVIELNFEMRQAMGEFRDLNEADRSKKLKN